MHPPPPGPSRGLLTRADCVADTEPAKDVRQLAGPAATRWPLLHLLVAFLPVVSAFPIALAIHLINESNTHRSNRAQALVVTLFVTLFVLPPLAYLMRGRRPTNPGCFALIVLGTSEAS